MRYTINEIKDRTVPIAKAYGVGQMSLFGSYARGEAKDDSDIDLYIEREIFMLMIMKMLIWKLCGIHCWRIFRR